MSSYEELNLRAGVFALICLAVCLVSIISLFWVPASIGFTLVLIAFTTYATIAMMNAKTTGGPV
ncbi:MAG: hypothetical protein JNK25_07530 [Phycisphaerae bacterium]|nr:hypothetical protein [Phycisphaerae bacterium]